MWDKLAIPSPADEVCYVFHHWSGETVNRSHVIVTTEACTPTPREGNDDQGLPAWYLARSVPRRACPHARNCIRCVYAVGEIIREDDVATLPRSLGHGDYSLSA
ncbi:MAG TPA: hypothetical protein VK196_18965 [Magnetospirillum sp.]|nr:hypothetical protein [Magnetospirillum sp.]